MLSDRTVQYGKAVRNIHLITLLVSLLGIMHFPFFLWFYLGLSPCCYYSVGTHERGLVTHEGITKNFNTKLLELHVPPATQCL